MVQIELTKLTLTDLGIILTLIGILSGFIGTMIKKGKRDLTKDNYSVFLESFFFSILYILIPLFILFIGIFLLEGNIISGWHFTLISGGVIIIGLQTLLNNFLWGKVSNLEVWKENKEHKTKKNNRIDWKKLRLIIPSFIAILLLFLQFELMKKLDIPIIPIIIFIISLIMWFLILLSIVSNYAVDFTSKFNISLNYNKKLFKNVKIFRIGNDFIDILIGKDYEKTITINKSNILSVEKIN